MDNQKIDQHVKKETTVIPIGNSLGIIIPIYYRDYLGLQDRDEVVIMDDTNKRGQRFVSFWKKE